MPSIRNSAYVVVLLGVLLSAGTGLGTAATSGTVIGATVPSATTLTASCPAAARRFGTVQPGSSALTGTDCGFTFGSSNNTSTLRLVQGDRSGRAMWAMSDGSLDMTWGDGDGTDNDAIRREATQNGRINKLVRKRDRTLIGVGLMNTSTNLAVWKFDAAGAPVAGFGTGGLAQLDLGVEEEGMSVALDSIGRIYVAGYTGVWGSNSRGSLLARFNPDGTLDTASDSTPSTSFNTVGYVTEQLAPANNDMFRDVAVDSLDRPVVAGFTSGGPSGMFARRYTTEGQLDTSFNGTGMRTVGSAGQGLAVAVQADDKVVLGGLDWSGAGGVSVYTARLNADGTLDTNVDSDAAAHWDTDGMRIDDVAPGAQDDLVNELRVLQDGRVAFVGSASTAGVADMAVGLYTTNGQPDTTFNGSGRRIIAFAGGAADAATSMHVDPGDGGITISGVANGQMGIARVTAAGGLDESFSGDGLLNLLGGGTAANGRAITLAEDGALIVAGETTVGGVTRPTLVRLNGGPSIADYDDAGGQDWSAGNMFGICMRTISGAATTWVTDAACTVADGTHWRSAPDTAVTVATVASGTTTAVANFRFGMKTPASQRAGVYVAPLEFEVLAP